MSPRESITALLKELARRLLPNARAVKIALFGLAGGLLLTLAAGGLVALQSLRSRRQLDERLVRLERRIEQDRMRRLRLEREIEDERTKSAQRRSRLEAELGSQLAALKSEEQRLRRQLEEARAHATLSAAQLSDLHGKLQETTRQISTLDSDRSLVERTIRRFQGAVGFIDGTWSWRDAGGRLLRASAVDEQGEPRRDPEGVPLVASDDEGTPLVSQFVGTGFLVSREGDILTNRHIAEPWWRERDLRRMATRGYVPHLDTLEIYFPGEEAPLPIAVRAVSATADVALVKADVKGRKIPVVEIEPGPQTASPGQPVVILGYPTGLDALLARVDDSVADAIVARSRGDWSRVARDLSGRKMIRPLATQGHLSDVLETQLVYDAATAQGGSGGPVFNARGRVIGLTSAALADFPGATFGVPIRFGLDLLPAVPKGEGRRRASR